MLSNFYQLGQVIMHNRTCERTGGHAQYRKCSLILNACVWCARMGIC